jgi:hypothetical protein
VLESTEAPRGPLYVFERDKPHLVDVPELSFVMVDGEGDLASETYAKTVTALMQVAAATWQLVDRVLPAPLGGLWSGDLAERSTWRLTSMALQPPEVSDETLAQAVESLDRDANVFDRLALRYPLEQDRANLRWADEALATLGKKPTG